MRLPIIEKKLEIANPNTVLEAGCGVGAMAYRLASRYDYRGYEPDPTSCSVAAKRLAALGGGELVVSSVPSIPDRLFDLLVAFEVLEHLEEDARVLGEWAEWIAPNGYVLVSVPAHPHRYGPADELVGHCRRYTRQQLTEVLEAAGFEIISIEPWGMPFGYLLEWVRNLLAARRLTPENVGTPGSGRLFQPPPALGWLIEMIMKPISMLQMPFLETDWGIGYVAFGRKSAPA